MRIMRERSAVQFRLRGLEMGISGRRVMLQSCPSRSKGQKWLIILIYMNETCIVGDLTLFFDGQIGVQGPSL